MSKLKSLLLPLALIFAAIATFEFGARYGASNMRAFAIASKLQITLGIYLQSESSMDDASKEAFFILIDNEIANGAMHRQIWYLSKEALSVLDNSLTKALSLRSEQILDKFTIMQNEEGISELEKNKLSEIQEAIFKAQAELNDK